MYKNFDGWNIRKKELHAHTDAPFYHEREIWWCIFGMNIGSEQDGSGPKYYRPALILKSLGGQTCLVVPLTTSTKSHPLRPSIGIIEGKEARALLSQIRTIDTRRLFKKMEFIDKDKFSRIRKAVKDML